MEQAKWIDKEGDPLGSQEQTITISGTRIYEDEVLPGPWNAVVGIAEEMCFFVEWAYNKLYDATYNDKPFLENVRDADGNYNVNDGFTQACKALYKEKHPEAAVLPKDYYFTSIYSRASGMLASQKELLDLYSVQNEQKIAECTDKVEQLKKELDTKSRIKAAIKSVMIDKKDGKEASIELSDIRYKVGQNEIIFFKPGKGHVKEDTLGYELELDDRIRWLAHQIKMIGQKIERLKAKKFDKPRRLTFGGAAFYKSKDTLGLKGDALEEWKKERQRRRQHIVLFSGRGVSTACNYQCFYNYIEHTLEIETMDRRKVKFWDVRFPYRGEELAGYMSRLDGGKKAVGFQLDFRTDKDGRRYFVPKATFTPERPVLRADHKNGIVGIDINADNIAMTEVDGKGKLVKQEVYHFDLLKGNHGQNVSELGRVCKKIVDHCAKVKKPLVKEALDLTKKRASMQYGNRKQHRMISIVAYSMIDQLLRGQAFQQYVKVFEVDPAYTSLIGKVKYMRHFGCSVHAAASYVIARRGLGLEEMIPSYLLLVTERKKKKKPTRTQIMRSGKASMTAKWKQVYKHVKGIATHYFYRKIEQYTTWKEFDEAAKDYRYA